MKIPPILAGVAGEFFVAGELSRRGHIASISLRNTRGIDIIATNQEASRSITIQCKTNQLARRKWMLNQKCEDFISSCHYYVFVALEGVSERPNYHIVPSQEVAAHIKNSHQDWLQTPGRAGRQHVDTPMRVFSDLDGTYLERWELLRL
jgi:hypothetical protein